jgi:hypothetical protein
MTLILKKYFKLWTAYIVLVFIFVFPFTTQAIEFSPALKNLHTEIKKAFPHNSARTIDGVTLKKIPGSYAVIMGLAMQKQKTMIGNNGQEAFDALDQEIIEVLYLLAKNNMDKSPSDGSSLTGIKMATDYNGAKRALGFYPPQLPLEPLARFAQVEENDAITLYEISLGAAEDVDTINYDDGAFPPDTIVGRWCYGKFTKKKE